MIGSQHSQGYRDDITGLRALAVLIVCAYHFGLPGFEGGFLGVDVFFVVSGYVITRMIRAEVADTGSFDFGRFYLRRVRRLLPALIATVAASFFVGALLLSPQELQAAAQTSIGALLSVSNVHFWLESGYFDANSITKPLLHTWSLSVEEQFYLVWPATIVAAILWARRWAPLVVCILGLLSFTANWAVEPLAVERVGQILPGIASYLEKGGPTIFFLTPFRVFEFAIGAIAVWTADRRARSWLSDASVVLGLLFVGYCTATYEEQMLFPSYNALLPCVGTFLVLQFGETSRVTQIALENRAAVKLGELSYSVYLVHWPIVVYYEKLDLVAPDIVRFFMLTAMTLTFAVALHQLVEKRFRRSPLQHETLISRFGGAIAFSVVAVLLPAAAAATDGWAWRVPIEVREIAAAEARAARETIASHNSDRPYDHEFAADGRRRVLIIGDSMADDFGLALRLGGWTEQIDLEVSNVSHMCLTVRAQRWTIPEYGFGKGAARACESIVDSALSDPLLQQADVVILTHNWYPWVRESDLIDTFNELRQASKGPAYIVGKRRWFEPKVSAQVLKRGTLDYANADAYRYREAGEINEVVKRAAEAASLGYVNWDDLVCMESQKKCLAVWDGQLLYRDEVHFNMIGARFFGERMREVASFKKMLTSTQGTLWYSPD